MALKVLAKCTHFPRPGKSLKREQGLENFGIDVKGP